MNLEEILNSLNATLTKENKRFVLQRTVEVNPSFKAIKTFKAVLWFIDSGKKINKISYQYEISDKILEDEKDFIWNKIDTEILNHLIINYQNIIGRDEVS